MSPLNSDENQFWQVAKRVSASFLLAFPTIAAYAIALPGIVLKAFQSVPPNQTSDKFPLNNPTISIPAVSVKKEEISFLIDRKSQSPSQNTLEQPIIKILLTII